MNDQHPYDESLGDKFSRLPVPDVNRTWPEMKKLLDKELPRGGGYSKRRGGWWSLSLILLLISGGSVLTMVSRDHPDGDPPISNRTIENKAGAEKKTNTKFSEKPVAVDDQILHSQSIINTKESGKTSGQADQLPTTIIGADETSNDPDRGNLVQFSTEGRPAKAPGSVLNKSGKVDVKSGGAIESSFNDASSGKALNIPADEEEAALQPVPALKGSSLYDQPAISSAFDSLDTETALAAQYAPVDRAFYRKNRRHYTPPNVRAPYSTEGRVLAVGISLPLGFPLGDQKMLGYNVSAGPNTASDYIPSVHVQYHKNEKTYLQAEFQVMSPQYIRPVMLHFNEYYSQGSRTTNSIYARKLYYFNVPVSVHYSPFKNFYLGTGIQFSSLLSGIAQHEQIRTGMVSSDSIYRSSYAKFGNDSLSSRLRGNEFRLLLDVNYYWNKFTVGLRYNQAMSNYVSMRSAPTAPYTFDKNKALQFYLRYNLWEKKRWKPIDQRPLRYK